MLPSAFLSQWLNGAGSGDGIQCTLCQMNYIFEQPELHIHPLAQRPLTRVLIDAIKKKKIHIVAETHSSELLQECLLQMRAGNLKLEDFVAFRVKRESQRTQLDKINIEKIDLGEGKMDYDVFYNWKKGFCEQV
ncbi:MAG TPA: hypothetical protein VNV43_02655 [Candidatus Acidoferrales bacterium]|nr:hypothetical protein [Candidatus Acidoferrales bacterium]